MTKTIKIAWIIVTLLLLTSLNMVGGCKGRIAKEKVKEEKKVEEKEKPAKKETNKETRHDLAIDKVNFSPAPTQTNKMESYTDYFFDPTNEMTVIVTVTNKSSNPEHNVPLVAALYQTQSGDLPPETNAQTVSDKKQIIKKLEPKESTDLTFKFTGLEKYTQSYHLAYVIKMKKTNDITPNDNEYRVYFWLLRGE